MTPTVPAVPGNTKLAGPWAAYRTWAATARYYKQDLDKWNRWSLQFAVAGAILGTLGQQLIPLAPAGSGLSSLYHGIGMAGAALTWLAVYFARQAMSDDREKTWTKARSIAEAIKSSIFTYRASAAPLDGPDALTRLNSRIEDLLKSAGVGPRPVPEEPAAALDSLTVDGYITARVEDQINFYNRRAHDYQIQVDKYRNLVSVLGGFSVLLGIGAAISVVSAWVAVVATITAAITAYVKNQRLQALIAIYTATALRLAMLKSAWAASGKTDSDKAERDAFIQRCEETMALENGSWVAQWAEQHPDQAPPNN